MPPDEKPWYLSQTVIAGLVTVLVSIGGLLGYQLTAEDSAELPALIVAAITAVTGLWAIIGRVLATKTLTGGKATLTAKERAMAKEAVRQLRGTKAA